MATVGEYGLAEIAKWVEVVDAFMVKAGGMYQHDHAKDHGLVRAVSLMLAKGAGWKQLGAGHFSAAYLTNLMDSDSRQVVVKIGFKPQADSAMAYLQWARQHQDLPGVPVVHSLNAARHRNGVWYCVTREYESRPAEYQREFCLLARRAVQSNNWKGEAWCYNKGGPVFASDLPEYLLPAIETCREIHDWFRDAASFDLHHENIMWDGDLPIINDPISFKSARAMREEVQHASPDPYSARRRGRAVPRWPADFRLILTPSEQPKQQHRWHAIKEKFA